jgi:hypothetical protein
MIEQTGIPLRFEQLQDKCHSSMPNEVVCEPVESDDEIQLPVMSGFHIHFFLFYCLNSHSELQVLFLCTGILTF